MDTKVSVGLVQMHCGANIHENVDKAVAAIHDVASDGAAIVCLPELFNAPYFCQQRRPRAF